MKSKQPMNALTVSFAFVILAGAACYLDGCGSSGGASCSRYRSRDLCSRLQRHSGSRNLSLLTLLNFLLGKVFVLFTNLKVGPVLISALSVRSL